MTEQSRKEVLAKKPRKKAAPKQEPKKQTMKVIVTDKMIFFHGMRYRKGAVFSVEGKDIPAGCKAYTPELDQKINKVEPKDQPKAFSEMAHGGRASGRRAAGQSID